MSITAAGASRSITPGVNTVAEQQNSVFGGEDGQAIFESSVVGRGGDGVQNHG
jgi:hypothetical protein